MSLPLTTSRSVSPGPKRVPDGRISMSSGTISPRRGLSSRWWARTGWDRVGRRVPAQAAGPGVEVQRLPRGAGQRPAVRGPPGAGARAVADLVAHGRPPGHLGVGSLEEVVEERLLAPQALGGVVIAPLLA